MLFDPRVEQGTEGFKPNVDNSIKKPTATKGEKFLFVFLYIITLGFFFIAVIARKNHLLAKMNKIQEASSLIQSAEKKRRAILIKQIDSIKGYAEFENTTLNEVTKLRSQLVELDDKKDPIAFSEKLKTIKNGINLQFEQYPNLKSDRLYLQFQTEISIQEDEIYATIRNYNAIVRSFNSEIYQFWTNIIAIKLNAYNQPLFQATFEERQDIDTSSLQGMFVK